MKKNNDTRIKAMESGYAKTAAAISVTLCYAEKTLRGNQTSKGRDDYEKSRGDNVTQRPRR